MQQKQNTTKKPRPSGFQGNATASDSIYRKVITGIGNQNIQYLALKTALAVYVGYQGHQLWSQSIREMQFIPNDEFDIPRVDKKKSRIWRGQQLWVPWPACQGKFELRNVPVTLRLQREAQTQVYLQTQQKRTIQGDQRTSQTSCMGRACHWFINSNCPIQLLEVLANRCSVVDIFKWKPMAAVEQIKSSLKQWQRPTGGITMIISVFKRHVEIYVQTACKSGGYYNII